MNWEPTRMAILVLKEIFGRGPPPGDTCDELSVPICSRDFSTASTACPWTFSSSRIDMTLIQKAPKIAQICKGPDNPKKPIFMQVMACIQDISRWLSSLISAGFLKARQWSHNLRLIHVTCICGEAQYCAGLNPARGNMEKLNGYEWKSDSEDGDDSLASQKAIRIWGPGKILVSNFIVNITDQPHLRPQPFLFPIRAEEVQPMSILRFL
ncbi:uncharacterized protein BDR25DRAFT_350082 [Lindgomyces ingoldianus]|uniref:Uncharacterized protein n=1 Tax=Lindgomyces ingoldianus TaxID=673940 RepID=A0ACB6R944_9PLEO|nr:uncharacterized protein BDR25DRAFT_350082 [Lindgomyces ingoldianus]KAF2475798.1 hypothetical protein BDR25DRAFT_350082 [Lindgomyces ingoldianus]